MASSLTKNYIHIIFHKHSHSSDIQSGDLDQVFAYISGIIWNLKGTPVIVGGVHDHIHILTTLPKNVSLADFVRTIKAESSKWIKSQSSFYKEFAWQNGYGAFSVSASQLDITKQYIKTQAEHHRGKTFIDEYKAFLEAYDVDYDERYAFGD
ncbi:MAG: transposase [Muribaculaceae bacterium]|nr:transposase [Muribaculaceae bacterium]